MKKVLFRNISSLIMFALVLGVFVSYPVYGCACGMLVPQNSKEISMTGERGLVVFDSKTNTEQMAIDFQLEGSSNQSALIVPTPVKAEIGQIKKEVIDDIDYLVNPPVYRESFSIGLSAGDTKSVEVLERKTVGNFEIAALKTNSYQDLFAWTNENGFLLQEEAEGPVRNYIDNEFVLNVIKLKKNSKTSDINPLLFTFETEDLFYPLMEVKDSRDDMKDKSLSLYLVTDIKTDLEYIPEVRNKKFTRTKITEAVTQTTEKDFSNLEFRASNYYITYIETDNYAASDSLVQELGNPQSAEYEPLGLEYPEPSFMSQWVVIAVSFALIMFFIALGAFVFIRRERNRQIPKV